MRYCIVYILLYIDTPLSADVWLLNSCTVKGPSEDGFKAAIKKGKELNKTLVVAGCVPQGQKDMDDIKDISVIGVQQIDRVVEVIEESLKGHVIKLYGQKRSNGRRLAGPSLELPKIRKNPLIEIIPINSGYDHQYNSVNFCIWFIDVSIIVLTVKLSIPEVI